MAMGIPSRRFALVAASTLIGFTALTGCSSDSDDTMSPSESASAAYCASVDAAATSLDALVATNVIEEGTATLRSRFDAFRADVDALVESAKSAFADETAAVEAAVAGLGDALQGVADSPSVAQVGEARAAIDEVSATSQTLIGAVRAACPTS